jgi:recombinational DNA repair protein RecR
MAFRFSNIKNLLFQIDQIKKNVDLDIKKLSKKFLIQNKHISKVIFRIKHNLHIDELANYIKNFKPMSKNSISKILMLGEENYKLSNNEIEY